MQIRTVLKVWLLSIFCMLVYSCTPAAPASPTIEIPPTEIIPPQAIVLGDISDDPAEVIDGSQPLADYLAANLTDYGITEGQVKVAASINEMTQLLKNGEVDLYFDSIYPATIISDAAGAQPILRRWRFGVEEYSTVIFASVDSGITSIDELPGAMVAMDAPYSTSGFLLPAVHLVENGLTLQGKRTFNDSVTTEEVGFVFSYDDQNTLQWVLSGLVAAGATDDYQFDIAFSTEATAKLVELARTTPVPRQVVVARSDIDPELLTAIIQVLTAAHIDENAQVALKTFQTSQFDQFPEGIDTAFSRMREMMAIVQYLPKP
jgi:phosphonate transport system substrate-binding protein